MSKKAVRNVDAAGERVLVRCKKAQIGSDANVYGGAVNTAARTAAAGKTLVSGTVRELARTSARVVF